MNRITQENAAQYVGKTLLWSDADVGRRPFHYFPLKVILVGSRYFVADRNHVAYEIPSEHDSDGGITFDSAK